MSKFESSIMAMPPIVKTLSIEQFFEGFVPITSLYAIMFSTVGHLDLKHIGWLFSIWSLAFLVGELPTGVIADFWSRKKIIIIGNTLRTIGLVVWIIWPTFIGYAIGFALWGMMISCSSGSVTAYLHQELHEDGLDKYFAKYYGRVSSVYFAGLLLGYLVASVLTLKHANLLIGLGAASSLIGSTVLLFSKERPYKRKATYLKTLSSGVKEFVGSKKLLYLGFGMFSIYMIIGVLEELIPRIYSDLGLNNTEVSLLLAAALATTVIFLAKMEAVVKFSYSAQMFCMALGVGFLIVGLSLGGKSSAILILVFSLIFQLMRPLFYHYLIDEVKGDEKATIGSIPGLFGGLLGAGAYSIIGWIAQKKSEKFSIAMYGAFWLIVLLVLFVIGLKYKTPKINNHKTMSELSQI